MTIKLSDNVCEKIVKKLKIEPISHPGGGAQRLSWDGLLNNKCFK